MLTKKYRIKRGEKWYSDGVMYVEGDIITVPADKPVCRAWEPLEEGPVVAKEPEKQEPEPEQARMFGKKRTSDRNVA